MFRPPLRRLVGPDRPRNIDMLREEDRSSDSRTAMSSSTTKTIGG
jgi:hypothetical protein